MSRLNLIASLNSTMMRIVNLYREISNDQDKILGLVFQAAEDENFRRIILQIHNDYIERLKVIDVLIESMKIEIEMFIRDENITLH